MNLEDALHAMAALSHEHRFGIYRMLVNAGRDGAAAGVIAVAIGIAPSSLTFHLQQLQRAGLVLQRRTGRNLIYSADVPAFQSLVDYLAAASGAGVDTGVQAARVNGMGAALSL